MSCLFLFFPPIVVNNFYWPNPSFVLLFFLTAKAIFFLPPGFTVTFGKGIDVIPQKKIKSNFLVGFCVCTLPIWLLLRPLVVALVVP